MEYLIPEVCRICERTSLLEPLFDKKHFIVLRKLRHIVDVSVIYLHILMDSPLDIYIDLPF